MLQRPAGHTGSAPRVTGTGAGRLALQGLDEPPRNYLAAAVRENFIETNRRAEGSRFAGCVPKLRGAGWIPHGEIGARTVELCG